MSDDFWHEPNNPALPFLKQLFPSVPAGYFAVEPGDGSPLIFLRVADLKQDNKGWYGATRKVQTQHSDELVDQIIMYPESGWRFLRRSRANQLILALNNLIVDYKTAAREYARELNRCSRCNKDLTDERSRWYSIGPECEKHWPWMIEAVNLEHDGKTYEELVRR